MPINRMIGRMVRNFQPAASTTSKLKKAGEKKASTDENKKEMGTLINRGH